MILPTLLCSWAPLVPLAISAAKFLAQTVVMIGVWYGAEWAITKYSENRNANVTVSNSDGSAPAAVDPDGDENGDEGQVVPDGSGRTTDITVTELEEAVDDIFAQMSPTEFLSDEAIELFALPSRTSRAHSALRLASVSSSEDVMLTNMSSAEYYTLVAEYFLSHFPSDTDLLDGWTAFFVAIVDNSKYIASEDRDEAVIQFQSYITSLLLTSTADTKDIMGLSLFLAGFLNVNA